MTIANFLGRTLSEDDVTRIMEHCHVDQMRDNDKVNMSYWRDIKYVNDNSEGGFINKGTFAFTVGIVLAFTFIERLFY
jgi:hypothetical protein